MIERPLDQSPDLQSPSATPSLPRPASRRYLSPIARRLAIWIAIISLGVIALFAASTWVFVNNDVSTLILQRNNQFGNAMASALAIEYQKSGSWNVNMSALLKFATGSGLAVDIRDASGELVASAAPGGVPSKSFGPNTVFPVVTDGARVGTVTLRAATGIKAAASALHQALARALWWSIAVAGSLAVLGGILVARRITRPVRALTQAARAMTGGDRGARVGPLKGEGELVELSRTFDHMASTLEREAELRQRMLADVAHELRTPLALLQASTEAMAEGLAEPDRRTMSSLHDETLRLGRLVGDLEVLALAEAAGLNLLLHPTDLAQAAEQAAEGLGHLFANGELTLVRDLRPTVVQGDEVRLHQIFTNLLMNAIKFTPDGGTVFLTVVPNEPVAQAVVADTGRGISPEEQPAIFDRFWRGKDGRQTTGSGIGLAVVRELVQAHGGEVTVQSEVGHGARFVVTMPLVVASSSRPRQTGSLIEPDWLTHRN
jgi:two-component system, OmpR family, sensor histidine kinase BaeS